MCQLAATEIGHTQGGVTASITPEQRAVTVDEFGTSPCNFRHTGTQTTVTAPYAEYTADVIAEVLESGNDQTGAAGAKYMGIGRTAGFIHTAQALTVVPHLSADSAKIISLLRATATGGLELNYSSESDVIFEVTFTGLVYESATDGENIGKIEITAS